MTDQQLKLDDSRRLTGPNIFGSKAGAVMEVVIAGYDHQQVIARWQTELKALLERIDYRPGEDTLWLAGDLVNRGPDSLETLRFAHAHRAISVLGNHDLHLLAAAAGAILLFEVVRQRTP